MTAAFLTRLLFSSISSSCVGSKCICDVLLPTNPSIMPSVFDCFRPFLVRWFLRPHNHSTFSTGLMVYNQADLLKHYYEDLTFMVEEYYSIIDEVNPVYSNVVIPRIDRLNLKINVGVVQYTWSSLNISSYISGVFAELSTLRSIVSRANEMLTNRAESSVKLIAEQSFVVLNNTNPTVYALLSDFIDVQVSLHCGSHLQC